MRTNAAGIALIRDFEKCALAAYQDQGRVWTIGWGHTRGVFPDDTCTLEMADAWFAEDLKSFEDLIPYLLPGISLSGNQFSALVSFCFNVGFGQKSVKDGFQVLKSGDQSTMYKCLLASDYAGAAAEFPKWIKVRGVKSAGLLRRRMAEQALFLKEDDHGTDRPGSGFNGADRGGDRDPDAAASGNGSGRAAEAREAIRAVSDSKGRGEALPPRGVSALIWHA